MYVQKRKQFYIQCVHFRELNLAIIPAYLQKENISKQMRMVVVLSFQGRTRTRMVIFFLFFHLFLRLKLLELLLTTIEIIILLHRKVPTTERNYS